MIVKFAKEPYPRFHGTLNLYFIYLILMDQPTKLAVSYAIMRFQQMPENMPT